MDVPRLLLLIGLMLLFLLLSGFYSASETAFSSINKYKYLVKAEEGNKKAKMIVFFNRHFDSSLISILIGNTVVNIALSTISTIVFLNVLNGLIDDGLISLLVSIGMTIIVYIFGETIPKMVAKKNPDLIVSLTCYPLIVFYIAFFPLTIILWAINFIFTKIFRNKKEPELSQEDFQNAIELEEKKGLFEENESDIIQASLEFGDTLVKEVLTPARRMFMIDLKGLNKDQLLSILKETDYSRIPMYYGSKDKIIGILIVKNFLNAYFENPFISITSTLEKPYFVSPKVKIDDLIEGMRKKKTQIAIVKQQEKVIGMVTSEDLVEELVGEIDERFDEEVEA